MREQELLCNYFDEWISQYKEGTVRDVTFKKWRMAAVRLKELAPNLLLKDLDRREYQKIINEYAETHEKVTVEGFHHMLKAAVLDAVDEGLLLRNPTRKISVKGENRRQKERSIFQ